MLYPADPRTSSDLPWALFGRRIKPLALAAAVANGAVGLGVADYIYFTGIPNLIVTLVAALGMISFGIAWWGARSRLVQIGFLLTVCVFSARGALSVMELGWLSPEVWISVSWVIAAGGAFLLERRAPPSWEPASYSGQHE